MYAVLEDLIELLTLERIEENIFRGQSRDIGSAQVFGGQVLGQALSISRLSPRTILSSIRSYSSRSMTRREKRMMKKGHQERVHVAHGDHPKRRL